MSLIDDMNNLDFNNVGAWPLPFKIIAILLIAAAVIGAGYYFDTEEQLIQLEKVQAKEDELKKTFETKQAKAANLAAYRQQMKEMEKTFGKLLLKLPGKAEVADLLVDINRVGLDSGLKFELFQPGKETKHEFYATYPIQIRITGTYHELGNFASGIAALPRIVTLHNLNIKPRKGGKSGTNLVMNATANTYRYLDKNEIKSKRKRNKKKKRR
jgi:type IV pilus assembly protein PilO